MSEGGLLVLADVADIRRPGFRRITALSQNNRELIVCSAREGSLMGETELRFEISQVHQLARACLAGDSRALTMPGLARTLAATVAALFRVGVFTGALITDGDFDGGTDDIDDREATADDADPD